MLHRVLIVAMAAAAMAAPVLATNGPVGDSDFQCFAAAALAETGIRKQLDDPKTPADQRDGLTKGAELLRTTSNWYLARISTLPPEKRTIADFQRAQTRTKALDKDAMSAMFKSCLDDAGADRNAALEQLLT